MQQRTTGKTGAREEADVGGDHRVVDGKSGDALCAPCSRRSAPIRAVYRVPPLDEARHGWRPSRTRRAWSYAV